MKFKTLAEIEERRAQIKVEMDQPDADLDALLDEVLQLNKNEEELRTKGASDKEKRERIAAGLEGNVIETRKETKPKTELEIRSSQEYIDAFARYIVSEDDKECRALLTVNAASGGSVPVPVFVETMISTAWEKDAILSKVHKLEIPGNLQVPFEKDADDAYLHGEGTTAVTEEDLELGIVEMKPANIKKWVRVSDEVVDLGGQKMVEYVYNELIEKVTKGLRAAVIADIAGANTSDSSSAIGIPKITEAPSLTVVANAEAELSDDAVDVYVIINRKTTKQFVAAKAAGNFAVDPYDGLGVLYMNGLPAYASASDNAVYMIVGDLKGETINYPKGQGVVTKKDDLTEAAADMVRYHGRQFAAHAVTRKGMFCNVAKPAAETTTT